MRLEIGAFHVKDIKFGDKTGYSNGILTVNKEELLKVVTWQIGRASCRERV